MLKYETNNMIPCSIPNINKKVAKVYLNWNMTYYFIIR